MSDKPRVFGCDELRTIVNVMDGVRESFNQRFTAEQLLAIYRAQLASDWDYYPDQWTEEQVEAALHGVPPQWDENEQPAVDAAEAAYRAEQLAAFRTRGKVR